MIKNLSILGDSISSYDGVSNDASANATIGINPYFYREPFSVEKTYWKLIMEKFGLTLCVNNSWSGGNLSDRNNPYSGVNRANNLSRDDGISPDLIIVFMGVNDLGRKVDISVFATDYEHTLMTIKEKYPNAFVCCVNLPDRDIVTKKRTELFNAAINTAVEAVGANFFVVDLFHSRINNDCYYTNSVDGLHPDEDGMRMIAEVIEEAIKSNCQGE